MTTDWLLRVGDGMNFINSSKYRIWAVNTNLNYGKHFVENVKPGDRLWFVQSKSKGKLLAVSTYRSHNRREVGPLIATTMTNEELGWTGEGPDWISDIEVHYTDLYNLSDCEMLTHIKGPATIRKYDLKCVINLAIEYSYIVRYSKVSYVM